MSKVTPIMLAGSVLLSAATSADAWQASTPASAAGKPKDIPQQIDPSHTKFKDNTEAFLLPVPSELVKQMKNRSYGSKLSSAVNPHVHNYAGLPKWQASLTLGAAISDVLLALDTQPKDRILAGLDDMIAGMKYLELPSMQINEVTGLRADYASNKIDQGKLVIGFNALRTQMLNFGKLALGQQNYGMLIVGGWARGANLTARMAQNYGDAMSDLTVLKVRDVIQSFIDLVGTGPEARPVAASLAKILPITARRPTPPTLSDAETIAKATGEILSLIKG